MFVFVSQPSTAPLMQSARPAAQATWHARAA
jgi:hypothetical protein